MDVLSRLYEAESTTSESRQREDEQTPSAVAALVSYLHP